MSKVAVIGGGAGGMMAACIAAGNGHQVTLYEQNEKLGKKIYITGKGRCNLTNACDTEDLFAAIIKNAKFLYSAFYQFTNQDLMAALEKNGLKLKEERGGRVFPASDKSSDVIKTLERMLRGAGATIRLHAHVEKILTQGGRIAGLAVNGEKMPFDKVILATGGYSYPLTGSTGEGHEMAQKLGHTIEQIHPSLIPLVSSDPICKQLQGLALKNVSLALLEGKKQRYCEQGEMLFTHFGVSGPLVLSASAHISDYRFADTSIVLDLKPALSREQLDRRILRDFEELKGKQLKNAVPKLFPKALGIEILKKIGLSGEISVGEVSRAQRESLVQAAKALTIKISGVRSVNEAIVTRGGVRIREVNPSTMESRKISGLFFAGELLDLDAYTGGFNLQIAFSTGYLAGAS